MKRTDDGYELSTGRKLGVCLPGLTGGKMAKPPSKLSLLLFDDRFWNQPPMTNEERYEIAEFMIGLWREWGGVADQATPNWKDIAKTATHDLRKAIRDRDSARSLLAAEKEVSSEFERSLGTAKNLLARCVVAAYSPSEILKAAPLQRTLPERIGVLYAQANKDKAGGEAVTEESP